ncbi:MAG: hypothetical protein QXU13_06605 [Desulfurococcaceae archaeon]
MWAGVCIKGLVKGLLITGITGFMLAGVCIYLYLVLINITLDFELFNYLIVNISAGFLVVYLLSRFLHVGVDSFLLLTGIKGRRVVKGLGICVE